jgi:hypothetical protein
VRGETRKLIDVYRFTFDEKRYEVQECDATMMTKAVKASNKKEKKP